MSTAELPRPSTPPEAYPTYGVRARACLSMWRGSFPSRYGATDSWMYSSTASAPKKVSPRPVTPSSVCTRTQRRFGNSPSRSVSTALIFTTSSTEGSLRSRGKWGEETENRTLVLLLPLFPPQAACGRPLERSDPPSAKHPPLPPYPNCASRSTTSPMFEASTTSAPVSYENGG